MHSIYHMHDEKRTRSWPARSLGRLELGTANYATFVRVDLLAIAWGICQEVNIMEYVRIGMHTIRDELVRQIVDLGVQDVVAEIKPIQIFLFV